MNNIKNTDLNLLKSFSALMQARSVTGAAVQMSIGQPAMSHSLARLRQLFDDPLFIRTSNGMEPTIRANELAEIISPVLSEIEEKLLTPATFEPVLIQRRFTIAMSDYLEVVLLPKLLAMITSQAPNVEVRVLQLDFASYGNMLDDGKIDFAVGMVNEQSSLHHKDFLFSDTRKCVYSPTLTGLSNPLNLQEYIQADHVVRSLAANSESFIDTELANLGKSRRVRLSTPRFTALPNILQKVPVIATLPGRMIEYCLQFEGLVVSQLPIPASSFDISTIWHAKQNNSAANQWFRTLLKTAASQP